MKKESSNNWVSWLALVLSIISILLWLCKYEPVTWTLLDSVLAVLSLVVAIISVLFGFNMFGLKSELKKDIDGKLQDVSDRYEIHAAKTMMYTEIRLLHMAVELNNIADIRQSVYMMLDTTEKTKNKDDIDYIINQLKELNERYGDELFNSTFKGKLRIRFERIGAFSDSAALFLQQFYI